MVLCHSVRLRGIHYLVNECKPIVNSRICQQDRSDSQFEGQLISETDIPAQLEMEDENTIDVLLQQTIGVY